MAGTEEVERLSVCNYMKGRRGQVGRYVVDVRSLLLSYTYRGELPSLGELPRSSKMRVMASTCHSICC